MKGRAASAALILALAASVPSKALAQGATDFPIPSSAKEAYSPIGEGFEAPIEPRKDLREPKPYIDDREKRLKAKRQERWPNAPTFFRDTELHANSRTYYFDEDQFGFDKPEAFTTGGWFAYQSGTLADVFQLRSVLYTTQPLSANAVAGETENLAADGDQITTLGQLHGLFKAAGQELIAGRQLVRTPFINPYDIRMIPLTFEGVALLPQERRGGFDYMASYLTRYKPLDQADFISFSEGLGIAGRDEGVLITGASYSNNGWNIGASNYWIKDALNTVYAEIDYLLPFGGGDGAPSVRAGVNILDQRTVGADLIAGAPYDTYQASARIVASYEGFVFTGAVSKTGDEADIQKPFGYSTSYTALVVTNFHQADVQAYLLRLSYDLAKLGFEGFKVEVAWGKGSGTPDLATNGGFADQEELDLRFVYEPHRGKLQGLRVELEYIDWQVFNNPILPSDELDQFRAIVNYAVPLL